MNTFSELLSENITRKEFLLKVGLLLLVATGISGILKRFSSFGAKDNGTSSGGYGSSKYGK